MPEYLQVLTTAGSEDEAERISTALVERRLAACVQIIGPMSSRYRWQGKIETAREWMCVAKTEAPRYPELETAIRELHSYDEPEIVATPIVAGSPVTSGGSARASNKTVDGFGALWTPQFFHQPLTTSNWAIKPWSSWSSMWQWIGNLPV